MLQPCIWTACRSVHDHCRHVEGGWSHGNFTADPPGAIAFLLTSQFKRMIPIAIAVTMAAMIGGIYLSFWIDSAPAPTVILLLTLVFLFAFFRRSQAKQITTG